MAQNPTAAPSGPPHGAIRKSKRGREEQGSQNRRAPLHDISNHAVEAVVTRPDSPMQVVLDIDGPDRNEPRCMGEYVIDIYKNHQMNEGCFLVPPNYMESKQREINQQMRGILIDWLVEVAEEYKLKPETLHLAVNYIDRFLAKLPVQRGKLQLVGITCMLIAAKYEEIYAPAVDEFVYISDNTYTRDEVLKMESVVLNHLGFELTVASIHNFLSRFLKIGQLLSEDRTSKSREEYFAEYIAELTLQDYRFIKFTPSMIAASAVCLTRQVFGQEPWNATLSHYTQYKHEDLEQCLRLLAQIVLTTSTQSLQAVKDKYSHRKFNQVSTTVPLDAIAFMVSSAS